MNPKRNTLNLLTDTLSTYLAVVCDSDVLLSIVLVIYMMIVSSYNKEKISDFDFTIIPSTIVTGIPLRRHQYAEILAHL